MTKNGPTTISTQLHRLKRRAKNQFRLAVEAHRQNLFLGRDFFEDKRVIIIAPANTVTDELNDFDLATYDIIIRMNNSAEVAQTRCAESRTDVLFHNLNEDGARAAGVLDKDLVAKQQIKKIVYPHASLDFLSRRIFVKIKRHRAALDVPVQMPPIEFYSGVVESLGGKMPTTGAVAVLFLLDCAFAELAIVGFTFFRTPYTAGHNVIISDAVEAIAWATATDLHDPEAEKSLILQRITQARKAGRNIRLGRYVSHFLKR